MAWDTTAENRIVDAIAETTVEASFVWTNPSGTVETIADAMAGEWTQTAEEPIAGIKKMETVDVIIRIASLAEATVYPDEGDQVALDNVKCRVTNRSKSFDGVILFYTLERLR